MIRSPNRMDMAHKPRLKTISLTMREDEIDFLDEIAKGKRIRRGALMRSILRGGIPNPLPDFFDEVISKELGR